MKLERSHSEEGYDGDTEVVKRRAILIHLYDTLPVYASVAFWRSIEEPDMSQALPLEVLTHCVRTAVACGDHAGRNRIVEIIIRRTQSSNEYWANNALKNINLQADERKVLVSDLYADLCECLIRALIDPERLFWEENFQHCLRFERKHTYQAFMRREGRWNNYARNVVDQSPGETAPLAGYLPPRQGSLSGGQVTRRVPRVLVGSLDRPVQDTSGGSEVWELDIEDKRAQQELLAIEGTDLLHLVLQLPEKLRSVVLLIFWEGRSEKDTAQIVGVTDRTVRNRLYEASKILRGQLEAERENT